MYKERIETCGKRIRIAMEIREMKQTDLCKLANIPKSSLSLYLSEAYEPKQDRVHSMAMALNVSEAWLMGYDVPMQKTDETITPSVKEIVEISPRERDLMQKFKNAPESTQEMLLQMIESALNTLK